jgi:hypothetical protein
MHAAYEALARDCLRLDCRISWWRVAQMTTNSNTKFPEAERSTGFKVALTLFLLALGVAFYFVGLGMVHNRFHQGGHIDRHGHESR